MTGGWLAVFHVGGWLVRPTDEGQARAGYHFGINATVGRVTTL